MRTSFKYKVGTDINGNRFLKVIPPISTGFSVQTNGNLPHTHREAMKTKNGAFIPDALMVNELLHYVHEYGTERQKEIMPLPIAPLT